MQGETVAVIGSGAREHELARALGESDQVAEVIGFPGNPGFDLLEKGRTENVNIKELADISRAVGELGVGFVVVGPEQPLVDGVVEYLAAKNPNVLVYGPSVAATLEKSKIDQRRLNELAGVRQPDWQEFSGLAGERMAFNYLQNRGARKAVLKADGLAGGKGALLIDDEEEALSAVHGMLSGELFGEAGKRMIIEGRGSGPEVSGTYILDGNGRKVRLPFAQDHKRLTDSEEEGADNPNTGGMGAYSPLAEGLLTDEIIAEMDAGIDATAEVMEQQGRAVSGTIYRGYMLIDGDKPMHIEDNSRFGDPEAEVIIPRVGVDFYELLSSAARGELSFTQADIDRSIGRFALTVCLAAPGYPNNPQKGSEIFGIKEAYDDDTFIHFGGVAEEDGRYYVNGGRVVFVTGFGDSLRAARNAAYHKIGHGGVSFKDMQVRYKIGALGLEVR